MKTPMTAQYGECIVEPLYWKFVSPIMPASQLHFLAKKNAELAGGRQ